MCGLRSSGDRAVPAGGLGLAQGKGRAGFHSFQDGGWHNWENFCSDTSSVKLNYLELQTGLHEIDLTFNDCQGLGFWGFFCHSILT